MPTSSFRHTSVLLEEVASLLGPALGPGTKVLDCTLGGGGHAERLLGTGADVIGLDRDEAALAEVERRLGGEPRLQLFHGDFREAERLVGNHAPFQAILADLGVSSPQLDEPARGFSFQRAGPLDMRMDPSRGAPLHERLREVGAEELTSVIRDLGEERAARRIARAIIAARDEGRLTDTAALAEVVSRAAPSRKRRQAIHPATRTFQALRIWVNDELGALDSLLSAIPRLLSPGGRAAIISFHSLEDRRVKQAFAKLCAGCVCPPDLPVCSCGKKPLFTKLTRRAVKASEAEASENPRARSARLRAVRRIEAGEEAAANDDEERTNG